METLKRQLVNIAEQCSEHRTDALETARVIMAYALMHKRLENYIEKEDVQENEINEYIDYRNRKRDLPGFKFTSEMLHLDDLDKDFFYRFKSISWGNIFANKKEVLSFIKSLDEYAEQDIHSVYHSLLTSEGLLSFDYHRDTSVIPAYCSLVMDYFERQKTQEQKNILLHVTDENMYFYYASCLEAKGFNIIVRDYDSVPTSLRDRRYADLKKHITILNDIYWDMRLYYEQANINPEKEVHFVLFDNFMISGKRDYKTFSELYETIQRENEETYCSGAYIDMSMGMIGERHADRRGNLFVKTKDACGRHIFAQTRLGGAIPQTGTYMDIYLLQKESTENIRIVDGNQFYELTKRGNIAKEKEEGQLLQTMLYGGDEQKVFEVNKNINRNGVLPFLYEYFRDIPQDERAMTNIVHMCKILHENNVYGKMLINEKHAFPKHCMYFFKEGGDAGEIPGYYLTQPVEVITISEEGFRYLYTHEKEDFLRDIYESRQGTGQEDVPTLKLR